MKNLSHFGSATGGTVAWIRINAAGKLRARDVNHDATEASYEGRSLFAAG